VCVFVNLPVTLALWRGWLPRGENRPCFWVAL
jgi:hypothetical protein